MCRLCKPGGCRGYSWLKVGSGRIISSYLLLLSKPVSALLALSFPPLRLGVSGAGAAARSGGDGAVGGAGRRQRSALEPSRSRPASRPALSHGTSWKRSHISILPVPVPDPVELSIVWSMADPWGAPQALDYSKSHPPASWLTHFVIQALLGA